MRVVPPSSTNSRVCSTAHGPTIKGIITADQDEVATLDTTAVINLFAVGKLALATAPQAEAAPLRGTLRPISISECVTPGEYLSCAFGARHYCRL